MVINLKECDLHRKECILSLKNWFGENLIIDFAENVKVNIISHFFYEFLVLIMVNMYVCVKNIMKKRKRKKLFQSISILDVEELSLQQIQ